MPPLIRTLNKVFLTLSAIVVGLAAVVAIVIYMQLNNHPSLEPYADYFVTSDVTTDAATEQAASNTGSVTARYFGTSTLLISDGETAIMTDGFFTRPSLGTMLWGELTPDTALIADTLAKAEVEALAAVIVVHSHHDHALDAPEVAKQTGALLVGSESTANIGRGWGLDESQIKVAAPRQAMSFGQFKVTLIPTPHAPAPPAIEKLSGAGDFITEPLRFPAKLSDFKEGGSFAVFIQHPKGNILIQASAGYEVDALDGIQADAVFLGIAGLGKQSGAYRDQYLETVMSNPGAKRVIPIHWDDFTLPLSQPLTPQIRAFDYFEGSMGVLVQQAEKNSELDLIMLPSFGQITLYP